MIKSKVDITHHDKTLRDVLPVEFDEYFDVPAYKLKDVKVLYEIDGTQIPWVGTHKNVLNWWVLETGHCVGWNENPARGWYFPIAKGKYTG